MGWAARANPFVFAKWKMARLKELCQVMPRAEVEQTLPKMSARDQAIVRQMLDQVQPRA